MFLETPHNSEVRLGQQNRVTRTHGLDLNSQSFIPQQSQPEGLRDCGLHCHGGSTRAPPHPAVSPRDPGASGAEVAACLSAGLRRSWGHRPRFPRCSRSQGRHRVGRERGDGSHVRARPPRALRTHFSNTFVHHLIKAHRL